MKKLLAVIFSLAVLAGCAANKSTEVTETSKTSETSTASVTAEKTETATVTTETTTVTTETTAEITAEAIGTSEIDYINGFVFIGQKNEAAVYEIRGEGFFRDENGEVTPLNNEIPYEWIYKLWDDIIVCQPLGNTQPCDVYIMTDGKPVLDEKISGQEHARMLNISKLYNDGFEITESVYDAYFLGSHTFKKYQLYRDKDGFHEYGSIVVPIDEFNKYYGEAAQVFVDDIAKKRGVNGVSVDMEIYEVLYRSDNSFILNCRSPLIAGDNDDICGYKHYNITLKPTTDGGLTEVYRDRGVYKTALIPEIAVYPEKMYVPKTEE